MRASLLPAKSAQLSATLRPRQHSDLRPLRLAILLFFSLLNCAEAWVREAPVSSIQFRIPPEESYYADLREACTTEACLDALERDYEFIPGYENTTRPPPNYYAADALADDHDKVLFGQRSESLLDWNGTLSPWLFIGCYRVTRDLSTVAGFLRPAGVSWKSDGPQQPEFGDYIWNPVNCTTACSSRNLTWAAVANGGLDCFCTNEASVLITQAPNVNYCSANCQESYFNGTHRYCGAVQDAAEVNQNVFYYSTYRVYDNIHGTSQGTLDPMRNIWYIAVTLERTVTWITDYGNTTAGFEWYLHASSTVTGEPMFPFHIKLDQPHYGLQYDLDNSSIIGYSLPDWPEKGRPPAPVPPPSDGSPAPPPTNYWFPQVHRYEMDSGDPANIFWYPKDTLGNLPTEDAIFLNGVTCLDSIYGIYYIVQPAIKFPFNEFNSYESKILGFDLADGTKEILGERSIYEVVAMAVDNRDHTLYGLMLDPGNLTFRAAFLFFRLGHSTMQLILPRNPFDPIVTIVQFHWTFAGKQKSEVVFNHDLYWNLEGPNLTQKYYQVASLALDSEENVTYVLYKEVPNVNKPYRLKGVSFANKSQDLKPEGVIPAPGMCQLQGCHDDEWGVAAMMISNPDPIIPWYRPRLEYVRFDIDGMMVEVKMQNFTMGGVQPYDINGDILPDKVDWENNQLGPRQNCSEMFGPNVSEYLGILPNDTMTEMCGANGGDISDCHPSIFSPRHIASTCEWYYNDTIRIYFCCDPESLLIGDPVDLKNQTIYGYHAGLNTWTFSAYGIYPVQMPVPLVPPVVEIFSVINGVSNVDLTYNPKDDIPLCKTGGVDARSSYNHGGTPYFTWSLLGYSCEFFDAYGATGPFAINSTLLDRLKSVLAANSVGSPTTYKKRGYKALHFPEHGILSPGCTYTFRLHVRGRWGLSTQKEFSLLKEAPPPVTGWLPTCDYQCNAATCEPPNECIMQEPGPLVGPMVPGERTCFCDENRYGLFCRGICSACSPYTTFGCDDGRMGSGKCKCRVGYDGDTCDEVLEFWLTDWSECTPCGVAVGTQYRNYRCTNIQTQEVVNDSRCAEDPPIAFQNCQPALCPCGPPPEIEGADNATTAINCAVVRSDESCAPVCQVGYIPVGVFKCYSANYIELGACTKAGDALVTLPGIQSAFKVKLPNWRGTKEEYLEISRLAVQLTYLASIAPVEVPLENIQVRIRDTPAFGRRLQESSRDTSRENIRRWWYNRFTRNNRNSSADGRKVNAKDTLNPEFKFSLNFTNFNGHRLSGAYANLPWGSTSDRASSSIASRLSAILGDDSSGYDILAARRLQTNYTHYEFVVTIAFPSSVEQTAAKAGLDTIFETPSLFENTFNAKMVEVYPTCSSGGNSSACNAVNNPPQAFDVSAPQITQVYAGTGQAVNITTTIPPRPTPYPEEQADHTELITGISLGVGIGLLGVCIPLIVLGVCHYQKKQRSTALEIIKPPELPPGPQRNWEMPESAKICDENGVALSGHAKREWQGGGTYEGQVTEGMRQGNGRMEWPNGKCYAGQWLYGRPHGHGLLHAPGERGWTYNGQFKDGQRDGVGRCESFARKMWYDGEWSGGLQNGMGENGNLPTLPGDLGSRVLPPPVAHIWWMEQGEQNEHVSISKVAPESRDLIGLALDATPDDWERLAGEDYIAGGRYGPPPSTLQDYSRLWGVCFGAADSWLPSSWGALIITRIMEDGALARWNMWQVRDFGSNANEIHPNALIWRVNGVEGDVEKMAEELCAEEGRHRIQLAVSNPPNIRFPKTTGLPWNKRPGAGHSLGQSLGQSLVSSQSLFMRNPSGPPPKSPVRQGRPNSASFRGSTPPHPSDLLRMSASGSTGLPGLAQLQLPGLPPASHKPPPTLAPGKPGLPALPNLPVVRDVSSLPALPSVQLPPHPSNATGPPSLNMPPVRLPSVQPHLSTLSLPPPPMNAPKPPPGRPITPMTPGGLPAGMPGSVYEPGPPPKKAPPPRVGYREVAAVRQIAQFGGHSQHPNPPG